MFRNIYCLMVVMSGFLFSSCDDHEYYDTSVKPGYILCADGRMLSESEYLSQSSTKAVGVVFSGRLDDGRYLAVLLKDGGALEYCDTLNMPQNTSCSETELDGFMNTTAMQNSYNERTGHGSPLADAVFSIHMFGQSDFIASVAEWRLLYSSRDIVNSTLAMLSSRGYDVDLVDTSGGKGCWYWTSTEVQRNAANQAWLFSMSSGAIHETPKTERHRYRAVVSVHPFYK